MDTKEKIFECLKESGPMSGVGIADKLGISRQAVSKHMRTFLIEGTVVKTGNTRGALFDLTEHAEPPEVIRKTVQVEGLEEHMVFENFSLQMDLDRLLSDQSKRIFSHAFTEILNNAVDHSGSEECDIEMSLDPINIMFKIRDFGIGLFYSIQSKFGLSDETAALQELIKGKTTTMAEKHTGEGIFFSSKGADCMSFRSHKIKLTFDNEKEDIFVERLREQKGTEVNFRISRRSRRSLREIFSEYAPEEYDFSFEKTRVSVKLFQAEYVSRSEAKRLVTGLEKFSEVILDFKGVRAIGQAFADEVFRVFRISHPGIAVTALNAEPEINAMIQHVVDNKI